MTKSLYKNITFFLANVMLCCFISFLYLLFNSKTFFIEWTLGGGSMQFSMTLIFDYISCLFLATVFCISSNVVWYSQSYMSEDKDANRFILLVFGFVISMALLIISPNIVSILLGWDGLGLVSYCLVVYYPTKKSSSAGMLTVLSNRVGDVCILIAIAWFSLVGDYNFLVWNESSELMNLNYLPLLMIFGAMTKSAQIPFSAWLPAAMAAPTPVSALVHSSTLVTAGVYLLIRFSFLMENWSLLLLFLSTMTMFMSGVVAIFEYDLKKIIALSTLSQLGVMMFSISLGMYTIALFHLITHALFKALLFLSAGALIHGIGGSQDIRHFGSLIKNFPLVGVCLNLANLSLCGIPFMSGFYSKDLIVELACQNSWNLFIILLMFISLGLTVLYSIRLVYYSFVNNSGSSPVTLICDNDYTLLVPIILLSMISIFSGASLNWLLFNFNPLIFLPVILKLGALLVVILSIIFMFSILNFKLELFNSSLIYFFMGSMWFFPILSGQSSSKNMLKWGASTLKILDQGWLEINTLNLYSTYSNSANNFISCIQSNSLKIHFLVFLLWLTLISIYFY
uniref:NADH-ubiquinone oxidoreductase chain 5 n=1 Tax=Simocephalus sibiricus TaxID=1472266 RepID=A0A8E6TSS2_9CRUS|nr:NADH dehydrogenase subunit 5 [Simocephalus sibiricus]